jgi:hypothetical protein
MNPSFIVFVLPGQAAKGWQFRQAQPSEFNRQSRHSTIADYFKPVAAASVRLFCGISTKHRTAALQHRRSSAASAELTFICLIDTQKIFRAAAIINRVTLVLTVKMFSDSLITKQ